MVPKFVSPEKEIQKLSDEQGEFRKLSPQEQGLVKEYFQAKKNQLECAQKIIARESSIQLIFQNVLIVYQELFLMYSTR